MGGRARWGEVEARSTSNLRLALFPNPLDINEGGPKHLLEKESPPLFWSGVRVLSSIKRSGFLPDAEVVTAVTTFGKGGLHYTGETHVLIGVSVVCDRCGYCGSVVMAVTVRTLPHLRNVCG
jgi:hypothetical protein